MMFAPSLRTLAVLSLALPLSAMAVDPASGRAESAKAVEARLRSLYPTQKFDEVRLAPLPGYFEVTMGRSVAYVEASGRYFLFGALWDMRERRDLSAERRAQLDRIDPAMLPQDLALAYGSGERVVHVFADPKCGYCRQLEQNLAKVEQLRVLVYPTPILGEGSVELTQRIWCSSDRAAAWKAWMLRGVEPAAAPAGCSAPIERLQTAAAQLGVKGTPTLISADGRRATGALPPEELMAWLSQGEPVAAARAPAKVQGAAQPQSPSGSLAQLTSRKTQP